MCYQPNISGSIQTDCTYSAQKIYGCSVDLRAQEHVWLSTHAWLSWIMRVTMANPQSWTLQTYHTINSHEQNSTAWNPQDLQAGCAHALQLICACTVETLQISRSMAAQVRICHAVTQQVCPLARNPGPVQKPQGSAYAAHLQGKQGIPRSTRMSGGSVLTAMVTTRACFCPLRLQQTNAFFSDRARAWCHYSEGYACLY